MQTWETWIEDIKNTQNNALQFIDKKIRNISNYRGIIFIVFLIFAVYSFNNLRTYWYHVASLISFFIFLVLVLIHRKLMKHREERLIILEILDEYEKKQENNLKDMPYDGREFLDKDKLEKFGLREEDLNYFPYLDDLHIIGENSLFQFLNQSVSVGGRFRLFEVVSNTSPNKEEIEHNQHAIEDMQSNTMFILDFQKELRKIKNVKDRLLSTKNLPFENSKKLKSLYTLIFSTFLSISTIASLAFALLDSVSFALFNVLFIIQVIVSFIIHKMYAAEFDFITNDISLYSKFNDLFSYISRQDFKASKNKSLLMDVTEAIKIIKTLHNLDSLDSLRKNIFSYALFNIFFPLNALLIWKYYNLSEEDRAILNKSFKAVEEFEMLISLSTVNLLKGNVCIPVIKDDLSLQCRGLVYPLIHEKNCISNNFDCKDDLNIITGSNMSGKTSFMRAIGVNAILAYAGAYVNANSFSLPLMRIFTSINVKDDISKGISTFYGELMRIKDIIEFANHSQDRLLVFIDEIFKGTNYQDRIFGAKKVLEKLSKINCIVFLTTHDFELCELENKKVKNYHFSEEYVNEKMVFSHKIKIGQCESTNAKELMKEIGIV